VQQSIGDVKGRKMNAYEMADELLRDNTQLTVKAAYMLRQQANRIAELEKELYFKNYYEELPDTPVGIYTTPQIKELSDEEIYELWCESDNTELLPEMRNKDGSINYIILTFAELLLKKASEK
jgi:hypothetical protein